ncbi:MAG: UDP-glucose 4-epimerase GalE [Hydrogenibacillus schlegelii]|nr:UDP-glucose 4-epimerase GalE [Hydrogenibacillus schlegelii]
MRVLLTGGAGYIGAHVAVALFEAGHEAVIVDNFSNAHPAVVRRIEAIVGRPVTVHRADLTDPAATAAVFQAEAARGGLDGVIHLAGLKAVGESVEKPLLYYRVNLIGTLHLLSAMQAAGVRTLVFSSSATVYGEASPPPFAETAPTAPTNPYGRTKRMIERMLEDAAAADPFLSFVALRYFNPVGAHESGLIGEDPRGVPNNLMPVVAQVAAGRREKLFIFGNDYPTPDGTGIRDYIHVMDLAEGHVRALEYAEAHRGYEVFNLGTGRGASVLEVVRAFEAASGRPVPYVFAPRRPGDVAVSLADPSKAERVLGWRARRDLAAMCRDAWRFQSRHPAGIAAASGEGETRPNAGPANGA